MKKFIKALLPAAILIALNTLVVEIYGGFSGKSLSDIPHWRLVAFGLMLLSMLPIVIGFVLKLLFDAFKGDRSLRIRTIAISYFAMMLAFASTYYVLAAFGDYDDCSTAYKSYSNRTPEEKAQPRNSSERAFHGIEYRLWRGVEQAAQTPLERKNRIDASPERIAAIVLANPLPKTIAFCRENRFSVFLDCLHLSVMTQTTVGYGDIVPANRLAKIGTEVQATASIVLLVVAFGLAIAIPIPSST